MGLLSLTNKYAVCVCHSSSELDVSKPFVLLIKKGFRSRVQQCCLPISSHAPSPNARCPSFSSLPQVATSHHAALRGERLLSARHELPQRHVQPAPAGRTTGAARARLPAIRARAYVG